jgi:hypothetical protein
MDPFYNAQCSNVLEKALRTPLGRSVISFFESFGADYCSVFPLNFIRSKLEKNEFKSPDEFVEAVKEIFTDTGRALGSDSEVTCALLTLSKMIENDSKRLLIGDRELNTEKIKKISELFRDTLNELPDCAEEMAEIVKDLKSAPNLDKDSNRNSEKEEKSDVDPHDIFKEVVSLPTDADMTNVISIITRYESAYSHENNVIKADFLRFNNNTLRMIKKYIDSIPKDGDRGKIELI